MKFRDGRIIYQTDEESAIKLLVALRGIIGLRIIGNMTKVLEAVENMD